MMFQGSRHVPEDAHFPLLQAAGATDVNGSTDFDRTNYFETVPKNQLGLALWLEADRMGFLLDHINEASFKNQLEVVKNERRQSVEQAPYQLLEEKMVQAMYPAPHPYHGNVIGSMEDLSRASLDDVREFWLTYYSPENASLAIVGDIDPATVKAEIERYFGSLVGRKKPPAPVVTPPVLRGQTVIRHEETVGRLPKVVVDWMAPPPYAPGSSELELLAEILSGTRASRLDAKLVYADQIAQAASVHLRSLKGGSVFELSVTLRPGRTAEEGLAAIDQVLADLKKHPPTAAELARAKNSLLTRSVLRLEGGNARAELFQEYVLYLGDANKLAWELEHTAQATLPDVRAAAERTLTGDRLVGLAIPTMSAGGAK
jgi:predicted Zn-dependent peptidase